MIGSRSRAFFPGTDLDTHVGAALCEVSVVVDYARGLAIEGDSMDQVQAVQRVCTSYLAALAVANGHIVRSGAAVPPASDGTPEVETVALESRGDALSWLEIERANILACVRRASGLALYDLVVRIAAAMAPFLRQAGPWDQAVGLHRIAVEAARHIGDQRARGGALAELGVVRRFMAAYPQAIEALNDAVAAFDAVGDRRGKADALNQVGIVWYLTADNEDAARAQTEALGLYRDLGYRLGQANALADLGMTYRQMSRFDAAVDAQSESLTIYRELGDRYGESNSLRDLGVVHCLMGAYDLAARHHQKRSTSTWSWTIACTRPTR
jgi:tetratricopeptide (TPR) repeat protein